MKFCLAIDVEQTAKISLSLEVKSYYVVNHFDKITICDRRIEIEGNRSKLSSLSVLLFNTNSSLYRQILKALSFCYLCTGSALTIKKITLISGDTQTEETEFLQPFRIGLTSVQPIKASELMGIFSSCANSESLLNTIILFIKAIQDNNFDNYWKSFNSIYSMISHSDKENEKLRDIRSFVESHSLLFSRTLSFISNDTSRDIRDLRIREFILNDWPNQNSAKAYAEMVKRFTDIRIITVLDETLPYRIEFLKSEGLDQDVHRHIALQKSVAHKDNVQLLCFYTLKYAYFVRNKYFHAEKATPVFILKDSSELRELSKISEILKCFLADLIRCNSYYL